MKDIFVTDESWSRLAIRLALGIVMFPHGAQKLLGWFGGHGFGATLASFSDNMHIPIFLSVLVILAESFGAVGLILGLFTRLCAFGIVCDMFGAIVLVHRHNGFFMNWLGKQAGEGFEYHILAIGMGIALMIGGAGRWSADRVLSRQLKQAKK